MDSAQQYVRYNYTVTLGKVHTVIILGDLEACMKPKTLFPFPFERLPCRPEI